MSEINHSNEGLNQQLNYKESTRLFHDSFNRLVEEVNKNFKKLSGGG